MSSRIAFDSVHSQEKQRFLKEKMEAVSQIIHKDFSKNDPISFCPVCRLSNIEFFGTYFGFPMDRCRDCCHIFTNPYPTEQALNYYYNSELKEFENKFFLDSYSGRLPIFQSRVNHISRLLRADAKLLDVGSSIGIFIDAINRFSAGLNVSVCEINSASCDYIKEKFPNANVINSDFLKADIAESSFDAISLWDTIEHLVSPDLFFKKISLILKRQGFLFFSTPNTNSFEWKIMDKNHVQLLPPGHVNLFNSTNIKMLLTRFNFDILGIHTLNASLDLTYILKEFQNKNKTNFESFFLSLIENDSNFFDMISRYLIENQMAGNMFIIAQKR